MDSTPDPQTETNPAPKVEPEGAYARHERHYFEDGNVALIVERTEFRLYGGFLGQRSKIMQVMINLAIPGVQTPDAPEGLRTIVLPDSAYDFGNLFDLLFAPNCPPYPPASPEFEVLISALKVAKKYGIDSVSETVSWHLHNALPISLQDFVSNPGLTMFKGVRAAQVVCAARDHDLPDLVLLALYAIATYPWSSSDIVSADDVHSRLPPTDRGRVIVGRDKIHAEAFKIILTMHEHIPSKGKCRALNSVQSRCAKGKPDMIWVDPDSAFNDFLRDPMRQLVVRHGCDFRTLCQRCAGAMSEKMQEDLEMFYDKLPGIFQLNQVASGVGEKNP